MSTADRQDASTPDVAARVRDAGFVRLIGAADGDSVAAVALVAMALREQGIPSQTSVIPVPEDAERATDGDLTIAVGRPAASADLTVGLDGTATRHCAALAREFDAGDLHLALAGTVAAEGHPGDRLTTAAADRGIERRPGVGVPTADLATGLAHSTLVHAPFSGEVAAARDTVEDLGTDAEAAPEGVGTDSTPAQTRRDMASQVALAVAGDPEGTPTGAEQVEVLLRPLSGGPFRTIEGYADVLDAVAHERPGLALAVALGGVDRERALAVWKRHASRVHEAIEEARTARYDGLFVAYCDGRPPVGSIADLVAGYRSPEPITLVVGDGVAAAQAREGADPPVGTVLERTVAAVGGDGGGTLTRGRASFDIPATEFVAAFKEEL